MHQNLRSQESGQILVVLALALVTLLAFTALAIDVGMVYSDRRYDQNVADAAALAGGQAAVKIISLVGTDEFNCNTGGQWVTSLSGWSPPAWLTATALDSILNSAINRAGTNSVAIEKGLANQNGAAFSCGQAGGDQYVDVKVFVSSVTKTSFIHFVFGGQMRNTVEAITRTHPRLPGMAGYALYALDPTCQEGIEIKGGGNQPLNVDIQNGGAFSRSCISSTGHGSMAADIGISCLKNNTHPEWCDPNDANFTPRLSPVTTDPYNIHIPQPKCSDRTVAPARTPSGNVLEPGFYDNNLSGHANLQLKPGLYCIQGDIKFNGGGSLTSIPGNGYPEGVTVVFMDGGLDATGNGSLDLIAALNTGPHAPNVIPGVVFMMASGNSSSLDMRGNSSIRFTGTVFCPESEIILGGTGDIYVSTQFIGFKFNYHGTESQKLNYDATKFFQNPPNLMLYK